MIITYPFLVAQLNVYDIEGDHHEALRLLAAQVRQEAVRLLTMSDEELFGLAYENNERYYGKTQAGI